ncbi:glutaredoxin 3 [Candidatus Endobugula sertula]|uniref:Glutaredoxin n=1 Tax=Candidatus Endobugula sertula TaxID=62101 RepID=A0A1D2QP37_9GAMM|nr:glutaredoxin 3 [Candidatus Endobugula sertula]
MCNAKVTIYTTRFCPFCIRAKSMLDNKSVDYQEIPIDNQPAVRREMIKKSGRRTVPQIWINDYHVGGCDELFSLERMGQLDNLLVNE